MWRNMWQYVRWPICDQYETICNQFLTQYVTICDNPWLNMCLLPICDSICDNIWQPQGWICFAPFRFPLWRLFVSAARFLSHSWSPSNSPHLPRLNAILLTLTLHYNKRKRKWCELSQLCSNQQFVSNSDLLRSPSEETLWLRWYNIINRWNILQWLKIRPVMYGYSFFAFFMQAAWQKGLVGSYQFIFFA